jgi:hypothetical protein
MYVEVFTVVYSSSRHEIGTMGPVWQIIRLESMIQREGLDSVCKNLLLVMSFHCMLLVHIYGILLI